YSLSGLDGALSSARGDSVLTDLPSSPAAIAGIIATDEIIMVLHWPWSPKDSIMPEDCREGSRNGEAGACACRLSEGLRQSRPMGRAQQSRRRSQCGGRTRGLPVEKPAGGPHPARLQVARIVTGAGTA